MAKVTVIVPVYNAEKYLRQCIESVLSQTLTDIELICVDDGSEDHSLSILNEYCSNDARIIILKSNHRGGGAARNLGLKYGTGKYISFLDADDYMDATMMEKMYLKMEAMDADICVCAVCFLFQATGAMQNNESGLRICNLPKQERFHYLDMPTYIFNTFHNWPWNKMFRYDFVRKKGLKFQEIFRTNDLLFTNQALIEANYITTVQEHLIIYRIDPDGNNCQMYNEVQLFGFYEAFSALQEFLKSKGIYEKLKQSFVNHALDGCIANLNLAEFTNNHKKIFDRLIDEIFPALDVEGQSDDYFYDFNKELYNLERFRQIQKKDYLKYIIFRAENLSSIFKNLQYDVYHTDCKVIALKKEIYELKIAANEVADYYNNEIDILYNSYSYRIGHSITKIPRWFGRILTRRK